MGKTDQLNISLGIVGVERHLHIAGEDPFKALEAYENDNEAFETSLKKAAEMFVREGDTDDVERFVSLIRALNDGIESANA